MLYSFIVIAYNEAKTIKRCIDGIIALNGLRDYELLIIDDASIDSTAVVVKQIAKHRKNVRLISNPVNMGRGFSRHVGVKTARGEFIAFVDADIILPKNWLRICMKEMEEFHAVGGIAIPDGDVCFVASLFKLMPKVVKHTTAITGNNGLFRSEALKQINYDSAMRDGEDVDNTWKLQEAGFKTKSIPGLVCIHDEKKSYFQSLHWLYQQGIGANKLFARFHSIRLPDVVFALFLLMLCSLPFSYKNYIFSLVPLTTLILGVTGVQIFQKFHFSISTSPIFFASVIVHSTLITAYLVGRTISLPRLAGFSLKETN